ncbi:MAG: hypothetical protein SF123_05830 [Chloroflexota bacterium]|nr:hypothetical protein [Chloroflexota bacterium]
MLRARLYVLILLAFVWALPAAAQTGGQFCVRAFEDRNGSGTRETNEPALTRGIVVTLVNADGVTVGGSFMENEPRAAEGILCFTRLAAGQYTAIVTSADFEATGQESFIAAVSDNQPPQVFDYGAQRISVAPASEPMATGMFGLDEQTLRLAVSAVGALIAMLGMAGLGALLSGMFLRRPRAATATGIGRMRAVNAADTGKLPRSR